MRRMVCSKKLATRYRYGWSAFCGRCCTELRLDWTICKAAFALANANDELCPAPQTILRRISASRPLLQEKSAFIWLRIAADMTWGHAMHDSRILLFEHRPDTFCKQSTVGPGEFA